MDRKYWQIAAGRFDRDYARYFIKYGIAFVGDEDTMKEVKKGDIVVLKQGLNQIVAAGEVVERDGKSTGDGVKECKEWLFDFDGWRLPAYCYVDWYKPDEPVKTEGLTIATIEKLPQSKHQQIANDLLSLPVHSHEPEPTPTEVIRDEQLLEHLISEGLRVSSADDLTTTINYK